MALGILEALVDLVKGEPDWHTKINGNNKKITDWAGDINSQMSNLEKDVPRLSVLVDGGKVKRYSGDLNLIDNTCEVYCDGTDWRALHKPGNFNGFCYTISLDGYASSVGYKTQEFRRVSTNEIYVRNQSSGMWSDRWVLNGNHTTRNLIIYVDVNTGNDDNDGQSAITSFKTIKRALESVPKTTHHYIELIVADGDYTAEGTINVLGFTGGYSGTGGSFVIRGNTSDRSKVKIHSMRIFGCYVYMAVHGFTFTSRDATDIAVYALNCSSIDFDFLAITGVVSSTIGFWISHGSSVRIANTSINNCYIGIRSYLFSGVSSQTLTGTGNNVVLNAQYGAEIVKAGTLPSGTTVESIAYGGEIK